MNTQKTIFNKLFSSKTNLKRNHKVNFNNMDDLSGMTDAIGTEVDEALEKFGKASELEREGKELTNSASSIIEDIKYQIEEVISTLSELGLENTPSVNDIISRFNTHVANYNQMLDEYHYQGDYHQEI